MKKNFDLLTYYNKFTSEELEQLDKQSNDFSKVAGMFEILKIIEDKLGKVHTVTCDIRKHVYKAQNDKFVIDDELQTKLFNLI